MTPEEVEAMLPRLAAHPDDDEPALLRVLHYLHCKKKEHDALHKAATEPLKAAGRLHRPTVVALERALDVVKTKLLDNAERIERERQEAIARGDRPRPPAAVEIRESGWDWEVEDIDRVPSSFLALNYATMRMHVGGKGEPEPIPGVRFRRKRTVIAR